MHRVAPLSATKKLYADATLSSPDLITTSSPRSSTPPSAAAQDGIGDSPPRKHVSPRSPAFSTSSTVDGSGDDASSSPVLPSLPAPRLSERAREHLRRVESPQRHTEAEENSQYVTASWGSPYTPADPRHLRQLSFSSEPSDDAPLHQLEISTPFLRSVPLVSPTGHERAHQSHLSETAAVLVNRARRPVRGITEDWIRTHTTNDLTSENRHWLSDGDYSEHSSLSGSISGDDAAWFEEPELQTPRASLVSPRLPRQPRRASHRYPRTRSSNETLKQAALSRANANMDNVSLDSGRGAQDTASIHTIDSVSEVASKVETPRVDRRPSMNGSIRGPAADVQIPATPTKPTKEAPMQTPRFKKKVPWKGKNILVYLPRDGERGPSGQGAIPLNASDTAAMLRSWDQLGYNTQGFDLDDSVAVSKSGLDPLENYSQSRNLWPNLDEIARERSQRKYQVTLPDLNGKHISHQP
jgi:hypothetical protein